MLSRATLVTGEAFDRQLDAYQLGRADAEAELDAASSCGTDVVFDAGALSTGV